MPVFTAIATALAAGLGMTLATSATATFISAVALTLQVVTTAAFMFGGVALSSSLAGKKAGGIADSPTYSATKQTQTNPDLPIPLLYGTVKVAGNRIWQDDNAENGIKRIVAFSDGEIEDFTDIRLNDIPTNEIKDIKIQKFYGTSSQGLPSGLPSGIGLDQLGSLKYLAYLYINVPKSDKIDINYNLTTVIKGRKIRVYTSPTQYTVKFSDNPAWVMFDFLTCYNGRGLCLNSRGEVDDEQIQKLFDMQSFIESANYCDELVTTNGVQQKRFTFNMIFDSQTSHKTLLDEIQRSCRGGLFTKNGKLQFKIDKAEPVSKVFYKSDILDGSETFQTLPNEENYEVLKIDYISPEHEWNKVQAYAELPLTRSGVPIEHTVNAYSVTNFQQASRLAWYYLNSKRLCPYFGSFKTGFKAYDLEVGQVISIPVILMGLENYKVKVASVINNGTGTFTINYRTYDERLYGDELGCKNPQILVTKLNDSAAFPPDIRNFNVIQKDNYYIFTWSYNGSKNDTFEIRQGENWENGKTIGKNITITTYQCEIESIGFKQFWIKSKNDYNYSQNAELDIISIDSIPELNTIEKINFFENQKSLGTYTKTYLYHGEIKLDPDDILWENTQNKWGEDIYYQYDGVHWGAKTATEGNFTSKIFDLGEITTSIISYNYTWGSVDNNSDCYIEWRYSTNREDWTDWSMLRMGSYEFRYYQVRIVLFSPNASQVWCNSFNLMVDVPDKFETQDVEVTNAAAGYDIKYNFHTVPSIVATVNDNINAFVVVTSKTNKGANLKIYNNNGGLITGKISLYLKGF